MDENALRRKIVSIAARMYAQEYIAGTAGNLSARLPHNVILSTPAGLHKAELYPNQLVTMTLEGEVLHAPRGLKPTSELPMHLEVYARRPDVNAIIHAHPITCVALSLVGISLQEPYLPEALVMLGPVPTTPYATPSSTENRDAIAGLIADHDALILAHHGTLTVGRTLDEAFDRLEVLEHTARTVALAQQLGVPRRLTPAAVAKVLALRYQMGLSPKEESTLALKIATEIERLLLDQDSPEW